MCALQSVNYLEEFSEKATKLMEQTSLNRQGDDMPCDVCNPCIEKKDYRSSAVIVQLMNELEKKWGIFIPDLHIDPTFFLKKAIHDRENMKPVIQDRKPIESQKENIKSLLEDLKHISLAKQYKIIMGMKENIFKNWWRVGKEKLRTKKEHSSIQQKEQFFKKIHAKIKDASNHWQKWSEEDPDFEIEEQVLHDAQTSLLQISRRFWKIFAKAFPIPRFSFIDDGIEIRWQTNEFKLVITFSDEVSDILVYAKDEKNFAHEWIRRKNVVKRVIFWLKKFQNS